MSEETTPAKTGDAAWREQREAISKRNADAHKRAQGALRERASTAQEAVRADALRESEQLRDLNRQISKQQSRKSR